MNNTSPAESLSPFENLVGQRVRLRRAEIRPVSQPVMTEVEVTVTRVHPEYNLLAGHEHSRYTYVQGYSEHGREIGARNPYGEDGSGHRDNIFAPGGTNAYIIDPTPGPMPIDWIILPRPPVPGEQEQPEGEPAADTGCPSLSRATHVCSRDGTIIAIDDTFACPDLGDWEPTQTEVLEHIDSTGVAVNSLVSAVIGIHQLLDGQECGSDTIASIIEILQDQLGLEVRDPFHAPEPPTT